MPMITELSRGATYHDGIPPIKSHGHIITWSCKIT